MEPSEKKEVVCDNRTADEEKSDSFKEGVEFQENLYNPGHYIGTGRVPPTVSAPGNATPLVVLCFFFAAFFLALGLLVAFGDVHVSSSGLIDSPEVNKWIGSGILVLASGLFLFFGFAYLRKARKYRKAKTALDNEPVEEREEEPVWQLTCPRCGCSHDVEYTKCPNCGYTYLV